jgi:hypothetical protein
MLRQCIFVLRSKVLVPDLDVLEVESRPKAAQNVVGCELFLALR